MKILIVEGMATSGKSSLINRITELMSASQVQLFSESETHIPIMDKPHDLHIDFFKSLLTSATQKNRELTIFDRFHITQAFRANADIAQYSDIENLLSEHESRVVYLKVDEFAIADRVKLATEHRDKKWGEYVSTKGSNFSEIADYYINQQNSQLRLLAQSKLHSSVFNTTDHNYEAIAKTIFKDWYSQN